MGSMDALPLHYVTRSAAYDAGEPHYLQLGATADRIITDKLLAREAAEGTSQDSVRYDLGEELYILPNTLQVVDPAQPGFCAVVTGPLNWDSNRRFFPVGTIVVDCRVGKPKAGRLYRNAEGEAAVNWFTRPKILQVGFQFTMEDGTFLEVSK